MQKASKTAPLSGPEAAAVARPPRRSIRGATAIEYGLIASLVVVVLLVNLTAFGNATTGMFNNISNRFASATAR